MLPLRHFGRPSFRRYLLRACGEAVILPAQLAEIRDDYASGYEKVYKNVPALCDEVERLRNVLAVVCDDVKKAWETESLAGISDVSSYIMKALGGT